MPLPLIEQGGPGGMLYCEYADSVSGERHALRFYVAPFDRTPSGASHDYLYTHAGPHPPSESGILATFAGLGAVWAPYYPPSWALSVVAVAYNQDGVLTILPVVPTASPIAGSGAPTLPAGVSVRRKFRLYQTGEEKHDIFLGHMPGTQVDLGSAVTPTAGGLDARDRAWVAYLSGPATGIVNERGQKLHEHASVAVWWADRRVAPTPGGEGTRDQFIGPTPPDLPQDGWLWVDTSGGQQPWPLKCYRASAAGWQDVGTVLPDGPCGSLYYRTQAGWTTLWPGKPGQVLTEQAAPTESPGLPACVLPAWQDTCCGTVIPPPPPKTPGDAANQCGSALHMATWLQQYYGRVRAALLSVGDALGSYTVVRLAALLTVLATGGVDAPVVWVVMQALRFSATTILAMGLNALLPALTSGDDARILCALYSCLPVAESGAPPITDQVIDCWGRGMAASHMPAGASAANLLGLLAKVLSVGSWQQLADYGWQEPSALCADCAQVRNALTGGAALVHAGAHALSGGARLAGQPLRSMTGGARLAPSAGGAMSGGAALVGTAGQALSGGAQSS